MKPTKILSAAVAVMMIAALLAGCTGATNATTSTPTAASASAVVSASAATSASASQQATATPAEPTKEPVKPITFTAFTTASIAAAPVWGDDPVSKIIKEQTGVSLDTEYTVGDSNEKLNMMLASGDYPELLFSINNDQLALFLKSNALVPLDDYIPKYGVNVQKVFGDKIGAMKGEIDGKTYGFNLAFGEIPTASPANVQVQLAVLKEFNYPKITTLDELGDLLLKYKKLYPKIDGEDTIGLSSSGAGWTFNIGFNNAALRTAGFQDDGNYFVDPATKQAKFGITTPEAKLYLQWLNKMYKEGLFDEDSFNLDMTPFNQKIASGRVLAIAVPSWFSGDGETSLRSAGKFDRCYAKLPLFVSKEAAANSRVHYYDPVGSWKSVITTKCADPVRAFQFYDTMWSEDMQVLVNWGVKDVNYTVNESGKREMKPEEITAQKSDSNYRQKTGIGLYSYWSCGAGVKDSTGQYINPFQVPEIEAAGYSPIEKEAIAAYNPDALTWANLYPAPQPSEWGFAWKLTLPSDSEGAVAEAKINNEIRGKAFYAMITAADETAFNSQWDKFVKACNDAGIGKREAEITTALAKRMELWYGKK